MVMGGPLTPNTTEEQELGLIFKDRVLVLLIGIGLTLLGLFFISAAMFTTLLTMEFLGILLLVAAALQLANAVMARHWRGFFLHVLAGLVQLILGAILLENPARLAIVLTLVLAVGLILSGLFRMIMALVHDFSGRIWVLFNGFVTLVLGLMIWRNWPDSGLWVIGLFLGIDTLLCGWTWVMFALILPRPESKLPPTAG